MGPMVGLEAYGNRPPTDIRSPERTARSESLYRIHYTGPLLEKILSYFFLRFYVLRATGIKLSVTWGVTSSNLVCNDFSEKNFYCLRDFPQTHQAVYFL